LNPASTDLRPVVVIGMGLVTPLGADVSNSWRRLTAGESGIVEGAGHAPLPADGTPRAVQLALAAAEEAAADGGIAVDGERLGCAVSCSKPILHGAAPEGLLWPDVVTHAVSRRFGAGGPVMNLSAACATGLQSVMTAAGWIAEGRCDAALAGAAESSLHSLYQAAFRQLGVLSPMGRTRPFDRRRDGFVMGEGAAVFLLESAERARDRGARVYGTLLGWDFGSDAHHATRFNGNGRRMADSLRRALRRARLEPKSLGYLNAHGTATELNDRLESQALIDVFGPDSPGVSSTKGATGHLLGATGAVELGFTLLALRDSVLPPNLHLAEPMTDKIDFVQTARRKEFRAAASVSFGFGGALASLAVGKE